MNTVKCPRCSLTNWPSNNCKRCGYIFGRDAFQHERDGEIENYAQLGNQSRRYNSAGSISTYGEPKTGLALTSMILGITAFLFCFVTAPVGFVMGIVALIKASRRPTEYGGQGFATAGVVLGGLATLFVPIVAAIAIPNLLAARRAANEGNAISALRMLHGAEETFIATAGAGTCGELKQLATSGLIDPTLASGKRSGYRYEVVFAIDKRACAVHATPETPYSGTRSFLISDDGVIRAASKHGAKADDRDPVLVPGSQVTRYRE